MNDEMYIKMKTTTLYGMPIVTRIDTWPSVSAAITGLNYHTACCNIALRALEKAINNGGLRPEMGPGLDMIRADLETLRETIKTMDDAATRLEEKENQEV